jgi:hypothetical protein
MAYKVQLILINAYYPYLPHYLMEAGWYHFFSLARDLNHGPTSK